MENSKQSKGAVAELQNTKYNIDWTGPLWLTKPLSHPERTLRIGTSCSGIGAPEQAIKQLGINHEIVFAGDIDKHAKNAYQSNYNAGNWNDQNWHNDMFKFDAKGFEGKVDIFIAGICCQPFSLAGKREGTDAQEGKLYKQFCNIVDECKPKVFMLENVKGMLSTRYGECWKKIKGALKKTGYDLHYQLLNAKDYGCPQNRERIIIIGFKEPTDFLFPRPIKLACSVRDVLDTDIKVNLPIKGYASKGIRPLTPRECLRIQGFSDDFKKVVSDSQTYKQAGNSISVQMLKAIFQQMDISQYGV